MDTMIKNGIERKMYKIIVAFPRFFGEPIKNIM